MATLYGIGVGPGDPELLTLKAQRIIRSVPVVAVPYARIESESYALEIVADILKPEQVVVKLHFPMVKDLAKRIEKRHEATLIMVEHLRTGKDVAFLTEGDPLLHSTFGYVLEHLPDDIQVEVIPGVSSIMAASAVAKAPLVQADETLAIFPVTRNNLAELEGILKSFDTVVLMKVYQMLDEIIPLLDKLDLLDKTILVERASHQESRVIKYLRNLDRGQVHYLSLVIIRAGMRNRE